MTIYTVIAGRRGASHLAIPAVGSLPALLLAGWLAARGWDRNPLSAMAQPYFQVPSFMCRGSCGLAPRAASISPSFTSESTPSSSMTLLKRCWLLLFFRRHGYGLTREPAADARDS